MKVNDYSPRGSRFNIKKNKNICTLNITSDTGRVNKLFSYDCSSVDELKGMNCLGNVTLPYTSQNGDSYYMFMIDSCGSGGCTFDYWPAVIGQNGAWAPDEPMSEESEEIDKVEIKTKNGINVVSFVISPSSLDEGISFNVSNGNIDVSSIEAKGRTKLSRKQITITGVLNYGSRATNDSPYIDVSTKKDDSEWNVNIIDNTENCPDLDNLFDTKVKMVAALTTWSDGNTDLECVSVKAVP